MQLIFSLLAFAAGVATAIVVPGSYVVIPYMSAEASHYVAILVANGFWAYGAYVLFNALDATTPQTSKFLYWFSALGSFIPWLSITVVTVIVTLNRWLGGQLNSLSDINGAMQLLYALFAFAQFDMWYLQRQKWRALKRGEHRLPDAPAHVPVFREAPAESWGPAIAVVALVLVAGLMYLIYQMSSGDASQQSAENGRGERLPITDMDATVATIKGHNDNRGVCELFADGSRLC